MKKIFLFIIILVVGALFIGCGGGSNSGSDEKSYTSVNLTIKDNGVIVKNTNIILEGTKTYKDTTDENGNVIFSSVQTGNYTLTVDGFENTKSITLTEEPYVNTIDISKKEETTTLMFYANSYNLDGSIEYKYGLTYSLYEMFNYGSTDKLNIVVYYKLSDNEVYRGKIYKNTSGDLHYKLTNVDSADFGNPNTLNNFINWAKENYPADNYILDLWNHGSGWNPYYDTKAINHEEGSSCLEIHELKEVTANKGIQTLFMDACVMQYIEVLTALKDNFSYVIASENSIPINSYNYTNLLTYLNKYDLIPAIKKFCAEQIEDEVWERKEADIQFTDLSQIDNLNKSIKEIAEFLIENKTTYTSEIHSARNNTPTIDSFGKDLEIFIDKINNSIENTEFNNLVKSYKSAKKSALLYNSTKDNAQGFEVNLPNKKEYNNRFTNYPKTNFAQETQWDKFLESL